MKFSKRLNLVLISSACVKLAKVFQNFISNNVSILSLNIEKISLHDLQHTCFLYCMEKNKTKKNKHCQVWQG